jgi:hypothetical protein
MWITGQILDDCGRALSGVTVEADGPSAMHRRRAVSNDDGHYVMCDLPRGIYNITFELPGYSTVTRNGLDLSNYVATIHARLQVVPAARDFA